MRYLPEEHGMKNRVCPSVYISLKLMNTFRLNFVLGENAKICWVNFV
jgi:hypothetical protein